MLDASLETPLDLREAAPCPGVVAVAFAVDVVIVVVFVVVVLVVVEESVPDGLLRWLRPTAELGIVDG